MISFFNDPMVKFPKYPFLLPTISIFEDSGYIFYGSVDGPFKLNGKKTYEVVSKVIPLIRKKHTVFEILEKNDLFKRHISFLNYYLIQLLQNDIKPLKIDLNG